MVTMTITRALKQYKDIEAELLLGHVLNKPKEFLYMNPDKKLTEVQRKRFIWMANQRRHNVPTAYLLGYKYFYGLKFKVTPDVLIPRPETEWLVEKSLTIIKAKLHQNKMRQINVLDVGTGSGCIAISISKSSPRKTTVFASDISAKALSVAKQNAKANKVKVTFIKSDLFKNIKQSFDVIIANLPYVPVADYKKLLPNLKYEPKLALTDGTDLFELLNQFLTEAREHLAPRGVILLEADPKFFKSKKAEGWLITKDIHSLDRFALIDRSLQKS